MHIRKSLLLVSAAGTALSCFSQEAPQRAIDPVTAGVAAGLTVEVLKGINNAIGADGRAQVRAAVRTNGPDGDDKAFESSSDLFDGWFGLEWDLDVDTGYVSAPNTGGRSHGGYAEIHYHYSSGAWRPNLDDYRDANDTDGYVFNFAWAQPDGTPQAGSNNVTSVASVAVAANDGEIVDTYKKQDGQIVRVGAGRRGNESDLSVGEVRTASFSQLTFSPEAFRFDVDGSQVTISPRFDATSIDVSHATASTNGPTLRNGQFAGLTAVGDETGSQLFRDSADASEGRTLFDSSGQAELTISGAALSFASLTIGALDGSGQPRDEYELLAEYFNSETAVQITAPAGAQEGYEPDVTHREVIFGQNTIDGSGIDPAIADAVVSPFLTEFDDGTNNREAEPMIGLLIGLEGSLLDALNRAASTPGTNLEQLLSSIADGEQFGLPTTLASQSSSFQTSFDTAVIPTPATGSAAVILGLLVLKRRR